MTGRPAPLAAAAIAQLEADGVDAVIGTVMNAAGLTQAKVVPLHEIRTFADPGLGASLVWHGFAIDRTGIAFTDDIGVVGDQRIRIDLAALRGIGGGLAWAPGGFFDQAGRPVAICCRGTLGRVEAALGDAGIDAVVGHEIEFVLVNPDGSRLSSTLWAQYGLAGVLDHEDFVRDVLAAAAVSGIGVEQLHAEYGVDQFEMSLTPQSPVAAADQLVLARILLGRVARRHGLRVSLSPVPFADGVGSGAHQHFSLTKAGVPLFSHGTAAAGMTSDGECALAGVLRGLPEAQAVLCGSIVSGLRMRLGNWAGASVCWGVENREAALRFVQGGPGTPHGGNVEVKVVDPAANPYFASAAILGLALDGISQRAALPPETAVDPAALSPAERPALLPGSQIEALEALDHSERLRLILGDSAVDMLVAVRRLEHQRYVDLDPEQLTEKFRMAWSV